MKLMVIIGYAFVSNIIYANDNGSNLTITESINH